MLKTTGKFFSAVLLCGSMAAHAQQTVFLDFDSGTDGSIVYTSDMRNQVQSIMEGHYSPWNFSFTQALPIAGDFSTVTFNAGSPGGLAEKIDVLNLDKSDSAVVNVSGLGIEDTADIVSATAIIGSHELGHLQGLRHLDSAGPIGLGLPTTLPGSVLLPVYPGPSSADETFDHLMASPASVGSTIADILAPSWFGERSAIKLTNNECHEEGECVVQGEGTLELDMLSIPNTIVEGANAGKTLVSEVFTAMGSIGAPGEIDVFEFLGQENEIWAIEVISAVLPGNSNVLDSFITVLLDGVEVDYYATPAENDDELETFDSILFDLVLPTDGLYTIEVNASPFVPADTGNYKLLGYNLFEDTSGPDPMPAPATFALFLLGLGALLRGTRRNRAA